jgi:hypothetical protein
MKAKMNELEKKFVKGIVTMRNQLFCYNILIGSRKKISAAEQRHYGSENYGKL